MLELIYYIDTRPGAPGAFASPEGVDDYGQWLRDRYRAMQVQDGKHTMYYGVAQHINRLIVEAQTGAHLHAIGPHAEAAALVIQEVSCGTVMPVRLPGTE